MDRFDKVFASILSTFAVSMALVLLLRYHGGLIPALVILSVTYMCVRYIWSDIAKQSRDLKRLLSICGAFEPVQNGAICTLEPGHSGDHLRLYSNGVLRHWPKGGE
jgi:hypothetical protein